MSSELQIHKQFTLAYKIKSILEWLNTFIAFSIHTYPVLYSVSINTIMFQYTVCCLSTVFMQNVPYCWLSLPLPSYLKVKFINERCLRNLVNTTAAWQSWQSKCSSGLKCLVVQLSLFIASNANELGFI